MLDTHANVRHDNERELFGTKHDLIDRCDARKELHKLESTLNAHHRVASADTFAVMTTAEVHAPLNRVYKARSLKEAVHNVLPVRAPPRATRTHTMHSRIEVTVIFGCESLDCCTWRFATVSETQVPPVKVMRKILHVIRKSVAVRACSQISALRRTSITT